VLLRGRPRPGTGNVIGEEIEPPVLVLLFLFAPQGRNGVLSQVPDDVQKVVERTAVVAVDVEIGGRTAGRRILQRQRMIDPILP
jgi:hypothetical protein